jgi:hypothetical protein
VRKALVFMHQEECNPTPQSAPDKPSKQAKLSSDIESVVKAALSTRSQQVFRAARPMRGRYFLHALARRPAFQRLPALLPVRKI